MPSSNESPVKIVVKPTLKKLEKLQTKRAKKISNMETPFKKVAIFLDRWVQVNFKTEGGKVGKWKPLALGGRFYGGGFDSNAKLLQDTGRLRASFLPFASKNNAGIGSKLPYSKKHEEGLDGLPQRRILPVKNEVIKDVTKIMEKHVKDSLK